MTPRPASRISECDTGMIQLQVLEVVREALVYVKNVNPVIDNKDAWLQIY